MPRPKKKIEPPATPPVVVCLPPIEKIAVDFSNEGLNNLAKKINEIIERI